MFFSDVFSDFLSWFDIFAQTFARAGDKAFDSISADPS